MGVPRGVRERYAAVESSLDRLHPHIRDTLIPWCDRRSLLLQGRKKTLESVSEKLGTGRYRRWSQLDDLLAYTIVVPTNSHEEQVLGKLGEFFVERRRRTRSDTQKAPDVFRFDATRWYGTVRGDPTPRNLLDEDLEIVFEIQVKTAFEHAWSDVTHALVYKGQLVDWSRKRLAAQLKAVVEQVDGLIDTFETAALGIQGSADWQTDAQAAALKVFLCLEEDDLLDAAVIPGSWQRFAESAYHLARRRSRDAEQATGVLLELCRRFDADVRDGSFLIASSGSLIQALVAYAIALWGPEHVRRVPVMWDEDLQRFYGDVVPPNTVDLED